MAPCWARAHLSGKPGSPLGCRAAGGQEDPPDQEQRARTDRRGGKEAAAGAATTQLRTGFDDQRAYDEENFIPKTGCDIYVSSRMQREMNDWERMSFASAESILTFKSQNML